MRLSKQNKHEQNRRRLIIGLLGALFALSILSSLSSLAIQNALPSSVQSVPSSAPNRNFLSDITSSVSNFLSGAGKSIGQFIVANFPHAKNVFASGPTYDYSMDQACVASGCTGYTGSSAFPTVTAGDTIIVTADSVSSAISSCTISDSSSRLTWTSLGILLSAPYGGNGGGDWTWVGVATSTGSTTVNVANCVGGSIIQYIGEQFTGLGAYSTDHTAENSGSPVSVGSFTPTTGQTVYAFGTFYNVKGATVASTGGAVYSNIINGISGYASNPSSGSCAGICQEVGDMYGQTTSATTASMSCTGATGGDESGGVCSLGAELVLVFNAPTIIQPIQCTMQSGSAASGDNNNLRRLAISVALDRFMRWIISQRCCSGQHHSNSNRAC